MTGFLTWTRGSSFLNASGTDFKSIFGSSSQPPILFVWAAALLRAVPGTSGVVVTAMSVQSFCERAQRERGEVGQADENEDDADEHAHEQRLVRLQRAGAGRHRVLSGPGPGQAEREDLGREPAAQHPDPADRG